MPAGGGVPQSKVVNAGESTLFGVETNIAYRITENLQIDFGYVYADSEYQEYNLQQIAETIDPSLEITGDNNIAAAGTSKAISPVISWPCRQSTQQHSLCVMT